MQLQSVIQPLGTLAYWRPIEWQDSSLCAVHGPLLAHDAIKHCPTGTRLSRALMESGRVGNSPDDNRSTRVKGTAVRKFQTDVSPANVRAIRGQETHRRSRGQGEELGSQDHDRRGTILGLCSCDHHSRQQVPRGRVCADMLARVVGAARGQGWPGAPRPDESPPGMAGELERARAVHTHTRALREISCGSEITRQRRA